jgi:hypothetical protein
MKITTIILLLLLLGCGGGTRPGPPQPSTIFFGDSIFGAWNLDTYFPGKGYVNGGMFGYRTDQMKAILPDVLSGNKVCHGLDGDATFPLSCVPGRAAQNHCDHGCMEQSASEQFW